MSGPMTLEQLRAISPFPWRQEIELGQCLVRLFDANNVEVPMFSITGFAIFMTRKLSEQSEPSKESTV